jgi:hypothetical protein
MAGGAVRLSVTGMRSGLLLALTDVITIVSRCIPAVRPAMLTLADRLFGVVPEVGLNVSQACDFVPVQTMPAPCDAVGGAFVQRIGTADQGAECGDGALMRAGFARFSDTNTDSVYWTHGSRR